MSKVKTLKGYAAIRKQFGWAATNQGEMDGISYETDEQVSHYARIKNWVIASDGFTIVAQDDDGLSDIHRTYLVKVTPKMVQSIVSKLKVFLAKKRTFEEVQKFLSKHGFETC